MATGTIFEVFSENLAEGVHDLGTDTLNAYLSNAAPSASADSVKTDLAEISTGNGYAGPIDIENATSRTGGTTSVTAVDKTVTASGGSVGPFAHVVIYNDTPTSPADPLIVTYPTASAVTLASGEEFTMDFGASLLTVAPAA